jgi:hypothetical protein
MRQQMSIEELNQHYGYRSFLPTTNILFFEETKALRIPLYRWNPEQGRTVFRSWRKRAIECPLYLDLMQIHNVVHFSFDEAQIVTDYCEFYKLVYSKGRIRFETDFPFPLVVEVSSWFVQIDKSDVPVGKYTEEVTCFLLGEGVSRRIDLHNQ